MEKTAPNFSYAITIITPPVQVYAVEEDDTRTLLATFETSGQHTFLATTRKTDLIGGEHAGLTGPLTTAAVIGLTPVAGTTGGQSGADGLSAYELAVQQGYDGTLDDWLASLKGEKGDPGEQGPPGTPGKDGEAPGADTVAAEMAKMFASAVDIEGPNAATNAWANSLQLGAAYFQPGTVMTHFGWRCSSADFSSVNSGAYYLGVWEQTADGEDWAPLGVSLNTQTQDTWADVLWQFRDGAITLSGRPLRFCLLLTREDGWRTDLTMGMRVSSTSVADTKVSYNGTDKNVVPKFFLKGYKMAEIVTVNPGTGTGEQGPPGRDGAPGRDGQDGAPGASAYELAVAHGYQGSEEAWLASLKGEQGDPGPQGPKGADAIVDQTYSPDSENAMSGKAVAEAIKGLSGGGGEGGTFSDTGHITGGTATGQYSTATGQNSTATGYSATATGNTAQATGYHATATGGYSKASEYYSTATGYSATATLGYSTATGAGSAASGHYSTATGYGAQATSDYSTATGHTAQATTYSTATGGNSTATGANSTATGANSTASAYCSTATGYSASAMEENSTATGANASASAEKSTATGAEASATGENATAMGYGAKAKGRGAFAIGAEAEAGEGEGALRISSESGFLDFRFVAPGSKISQQYLNNEPGIMYYVTPTQNVYISLTQLAAAVNQADTGGSSSGGKAEEFSVLGRIRHEMVSTLVPCTDHASLVPNGSNATAIVDCAGFMTKYHESVIESATLYNFSSRYFSGICMGLFVGIMDDRLEGLSLLAINDDIIYHADGSATFCFPLRSNADYWNIPGMAPIFCLFLKKRPPEELCNIWKGEALKSELLEYLVNIEQPGPTKDATHDPQMRAVMADGSFGYKPPCFSVRSFQGPALTSWQQSEFN